MWGWGVVVWGGADGVVGREMENCSGSLGVSLLRGFGGGNSGCERYTVKLFWGPAGVVMGFFLFLGSLAAVIGSEAVGFPAPLVPVLTEWEVLGSLLPRGALSVGFGGASGGF